MGDLVSPIRLGILIATALEHEVPLQLLDHSQDARKSAPFQF